MQAHTQAANIDRQTRTEALQEDLAELSQTGRGTPMGTLLRMFWRAVGTSEELPPGKAKPIRVLGEDLTLYRGESGNAHIVAYRCAHRRSVLHTGWVEGDNIRCMYHGWMYDGTGQCVQQPCEDPGFAQKVRITSYPVKEYAGLIFTYMGEGEPPEFDLPRRHELELPYGVRWTRGDVVWPMNWFQSVENSLDAAHVSFVHRTGRIGSFGAAVTDLVPELEYSETEAGIRQIARRSANNVRVSDWTFPHNNHVIVPGLQKGDPWTHVCAYTSPVDDEHTLRLYAHWSAAEGEAADRLCEYLATGAQRYNPVEHHDELFYEGKYPDDPNNLTTAQDYVAQMGQGTIVDRSLERLGKSDAGVIFLRRIFFRELHAAKRGLPTKQWRRLLEAVDLPTQPGDRD